MPTQSVLKQHDRRVTDLKTLINQEELLKGTVRAYHQSARKSLEKYKEWCKMHSIKPENIVLPETDNIIL